MKLLLDQNRKESLEPAKGIVIAIVTATALWTIAIFFLHAFLARPQA